MIKTFDGKYVVATGYIVNGIGDIYLYKKNGDLEHDTLYPGIYTYDSLCNDPITSNMISLGGCDIITDINEVPTLEEYNEKKKTIQIKVYPNPAMEGFITLEYINTEHHSDIELKCFNVIGEEVYNEQVYQHQGESKLNINNWQKGIYLAIIETRG